MKANERAQGQLTVVNSPDAGQKAAARPPVSRRLSELEFVLRFREAYETPGALIVVNVEQGEQSEPAWLMLAEHDRERLSQGAEVLRSYGHLCSDTSTVQGRRGDVVRFTKVGSRPPRGQVTESGFLE